MSTVVKDLGPVTAYAYAVAGGYTGTEEEFTELLGDLAATVADLESLTVTVTTLTPGSSATASYEDGVLALGIPQGAKGDTGTAATIAVGTVTTVAPTQNASVTNTGSSSAAVFAFSIPRGDGVATVTKTGTSGNVDTYTMTSDRGVTLGTFTVTNGNVSSVNGKTGAVVLDAGDLGYDGSETYSEGTVGAEISRLKSHISDIEGTIDYEIAPITPTSYYTMPNTGKELNWQGNLVDNALVDSSDYIEINDELYDICKIVTNNTKFGLGSICYYNASKGFIRRDMPGTNYDFSIYNGETVVWFNIDKTTPNIKYVRFCADNNRSWKYWVVKQGPQSTVLNDYAKLSQYGKTIVNFGDSIFGQTRPPKDISSYLATLTGATVYNCGFGGCEMSAHADSNYDAFSMYRLADAVATNTWTTQETAAAASGMPAYFAETVALLKTLDFSKIDFVTIGYGTNDFNNGSPLDNGGNSDMSYFADALRYSIETLLTAFPNLHIFVCCPTYRFWMNESYEFVDDSNTHENSNNDTLVDFVEKTIAVAGEYQLPVINDYEIGMNKYNRTQYFPTTDGTHPNSTGNQLIAAKIAHELYCY